MADAPDPVAWAVKRPDGIVFIPHAFSMEPGGREAADHVAKLNDGWRTVPLFEKVVWPKPEPIDHHLDGVLYRVEGDWVIQAVNDCTCGTQGSLYPHEPYCGWEPVAKVTDMLEALRAITVADLA